MASLAKPACPQGAFAPDPTTASGRSRERKFPFRLHRDPGQAGSNNDNGKAHGRPSICWVLATGLGVRKALHMLDFMQQHWRVMWVLRPMRGDRLPRSCSQCAGQVHSPTRVLTSPSRVGTQLRTCSEEPEHRLGPHSQGWWPGNWQPWVGTQPLPLAPVRPQAKGFPEPVPSPGGWGGIGG